MARAFPLFALLGTGHRRHRNAEGLSLQDPDDEPGKVIGRFNTTSRELGGDSHDGYTIEDVWRPVAGSAPAKW